MTETLPTREESINDAYTSRIKNLQETNAASVEAAEAAAAESGLESVESELPDEARFSSADDLELEQEELGVADEEGEDQGPPTMSWTKAEIVDYLNSTTGTSRDELEAMTKAEMLDRYVDADG